MIMEHKNFKKICLLVCVKLFYYDFSGNHHLRCSPAENLSPVRESLGHLTCLAVQIKKMFRRANQFWCAVYHGMRDG